MRSIDLTDTAFDSAFFPTDSMNKNESGKITQTYMYTYRVNIYEKQDMAHPLKRKMSEKVSYVSLLLWHDIALSHQAGCVIFPLTTRITSPDARAHCNTDVLQRKREKKRVVKWLKECRRSSLSHSKIPQRTSERLLNPADHFFHNTHANVKLANKQDSFHSSEELPLHERASWESSPLFFHSLPNSRFWRVM